VQNAQAEFARMLSKYLIPESFCAKFDAKKSILNHFAHRSAKHKKPLQPAPVKG
jgi:hypothetical protein